MADNDDVDMSLLFTVWKRQLSCLDTTHALAIDGLHTPCWRRLQDLSCVFSESCLKYFEEIEVLPIVSWS